MQRLDPKSHDLHVFSCHGSKCTGKGAPALRVALARALRRLGVKVRVSRTSCQGHCKSGPVFFIEGKRARVWGRVGPDDIDRLARKVADRKR